MRKQFIHGPDDASGIVFRLEHEIFRKNDFTKNMANEKTTIHICTWARCSWNLVGLELEWRRWGRIFQIFSNNNKQN